ncbi:uncharacterized protein LOC105663088 [Megachile rotundata]|uniref:uncharacterized protein LOC105663088 n=1 Tax=Megachile rotundata TaxID=143995 RepID=UPI003FD396C2
MTLCIIFYRNMSSCDSYSFQSQSETSSFTESDNVNENKNEVPKNEFGNFQETYNWIECESVRFPGQTYFFNLRTQSSTWLRPVSKDVRLRRFNRKSKIYDNYSTSDVEIPSLLSSESEKENCEHIDNEQNGRTNKNSEILALLYYGTSMDFCNNNESQYCINYFNYAVKNLCNKGSDFHDSSFRKNIEDETGCDKSVDENLAIIASNFLEVELSTSDAELNLKENIVPANEDDTSATEKTVDYSTSSTDDEKKENDVCQDYIRPRLKRIRAQYLLKEKLKNGKRRKVKTKRIPLQEKKLQEIKIVREMYGTTTVSYDPVEPELPPGVKRRNLSDSSTTSSSGDEGYGKTVVSNNTEFLDINFHVANLSSKSSSSSCSNSSFSSSCSCSCSSCSSSTSNTTTNTLRANALTTEQSTQ